jgi:5-(carboxyamino)imidazole ribonucleotide synthase
MLKSYFKEKPLTLGILGGGQLAKMLANDAYRMGINICIIENGENSPAGDMTKNDFYKGWFNDEDLERFIELSDIVTLENEFISTDILERINLKKKVYPSPDTMRLVQDKYTQKLTFSNNGIDVAKFEKLDSIDSAVEFGELVKYPFLIKTRKLGYDGYGNFTVKSKEDINTAWKKFKSDNPDRELMGESFIDFSKELAVMVARSVSGEIEVYPCVETIQQNHICHMVIAPAEIDETIRKKAQEIAVKCVESINGVGVFGVEMFLTNSNNILVNEIAPRPHNSGHYTIEGCYTSQFENCIRAVLDLPLGSAELVMNSAVMINLLGSRDGIGVPSDISKMLSNKKAFLHLYNKKQCRKGRKMGHITAIGNSQKEALNIANKAYNDFEW